MTRHDAIEFAYSIGFRVATGTGDSERLQAMRWLNDEIDAICTRISVLILSGRFRDERACCLLRSDMGKALEALATEEPPVVEQCVFDFAGA